MEETWAEELDLDTCLDRLRAHTVGRVGVLVEGFPLVLPVNYRLMETAGRTWVVLRTRTGNVIDTASERVAFEIDGIDAFRERFDPEPWLGERDSWLMIEPFSITGRELRAAEQLWAYDARAYL
jgi:hypothetical protein